MNFNEIMGRGTFAIDTASERWHAKHPEQRECEKQEVAISAVRDRVVEAALALEHDHHCTCVCAFCAAVRDLEILMAKAKEASDGG